MSKKKKIILIIVAIVLLLAILGLYVYSRRVSVADCAGAGEKIGTMLVNGKKCCDGLKPIPVISETENENVVSETSDTAICSNCGNGLCEKWENKFNCSLDCK